MVWIPSGKFLMGSDNNKSRKDEMPIHKVYVDGFWMDKTEVTNDQFALFVNATGYVTTAEKIPDWNELKKELPPDTPKPEDSLLKAGSLVFVPSKGPVKLNGYENWWKWSLRLVGNIQKVQIVLLKERQSSCCSHFMV